MKLNIQNSNLEITAGTTKQFPVFSMPQIAFSGRSNVGKSSLMNKIFNRKSLVRVSSVPGKTITVNFFRVEDVRFVDLPGYGYAKLPDKEKIRFADLMENYFNSLRDIRLVVQLVDMRHKPSNDDIGMISFLKENGFNFVIAMTKADKLNKTEFAKQTESISNLLTEMGVDVPVIPFSAMNGMGVDEIKKVIEGVI